MSSDSVRTSGAFATDELSLAQFAADVHYYLHLNPRQLGRESDEEVSARLSSVRGIGQWTADMFLMFQLRRLDIWPTGDLGVRRGFGLAWGIPTPTAKELDARGEPYHPYRSVVAWYCWRAAEIYGGTADSALTR